MTLEAASPDRDKKVVRFRQSLEWTRAGHGARLMMLVLHDDPEREYEYGPANGLPDTRLALSLMRWWLKPGSPAGSLLVSRTTGNAFSISRS